MRRLLLMLVLCGVIFYVGRFYFFDVALCWQAHGSWSYERRLCTVGLYEVSVDDTSAAFNMVHRGVDEVWKFVRIAGVE